MITEIPQLAVGQLLNKQHPLVKPMKGFWVAGAGPRGLMWHDLTDGRNHVTLNGPTWNTKSHPGGFGSLQFDGVDDVGQIANESNFDQSSALTITAWIYWTNSATEEVFEAIVAKRDGVDFSWEFRIDERIGGLEDELSFLMSTGGALLGNPVVENVWTHVAVTFDSGTAWIYQNGVQTATAGGFTLVPNNTPVTIGRNADDEHQFAGRISHVAIYDRALSATDIRADIIESTTGYPNLLNRLRRRVYPVTVAPVGNPWYYNIQQEATA